MHALDTSTKLPELFGPYCLRSRIAVGGSAEVYLAEIRGSTVAPAIVVKRLLPSVRALHLSEDVEVLMREAKLHRAVQHPNVVHVLDAGSVEGEPYIAMEHVDGLDLYRLLQRSSSTRQAIPAELAVFIARCVADALDAVHSARDEEGEQLFLVHGDVSPSNIYLSSLGEVKLGDFGIAQLADNTEEQPESGKGAGHFGYLAPERLTGDGFDHRVDLFALGVILGELLIGERVFPGTGQLAVMLSIRDGNIAPLRQAASRLPAGLFEVCERCLAKDPLERFSSAKELSEALKPFEMPSTEKLSKSLASWVSWGKDNDRFVRDLEQRVRESVGVMRAVSRSNSGIQALSELEAQEAKQVQEEPAIPLINSNEMARVRRRASSDELSVPFPKLIEMVATGELQLTDEVALWGAPFQRVGKIEELARHLLPSTTARTSRQFAPGPPDYIADFDEVSMLSLLGRFHNDKETVALFVNRSLKDREDRKDIYIKEGRLLHVASTDPQELLGEYLVRQGVISRHELEQALPKLASSGAQLGETLISMGLAEAVEVFTALRNQGRDRLAALCAWQQGHGQVYRGASPEQTMFPLDLDLTVCMMAGAAQAGLQPPTGVRLVPGEHAIAPGEKASSVGLLDLVPMVARKRLGIEAALAELTELHQRHSKADAAAAVVTAQALEWVDFS